MRWMIFSGAGISKDSGIPTFEELGDLRMQLTRTKFKQNPQAIYDILSGIEAVAAKAVPNEAHIAIAKAQLPVVTMNIDGLHQRAGSKDVLEIHGQLREVFCPSCQQDFPYETVQKSLLSPCCGQILQPKVVLYEDGLNDLHKGFEMLEKVDGLLIVGTSFYTSTATYFFNQAKAMDLPIEIINSDAATVVPAFIKSRV